MPSSRTLVVVGAFTFTVAVLGCTSSPAPLAGVDGRRLTLGVDSFAVFLIRGNDTTETGRVIDALAIQEQDGRRLLSRVYQARDQVLGIGIDSLMDDLVTMAPVRHRSRRTRGSEFLEFGRGRVTGTSQTPNGHSTSIDMPLPGTVFNSSSFDLVLRAASLHEGWTTTMPAFLAGSRSVIELKAMVAGVETVHGQRCWRVEADFAGMPVTFWITQDGRKLRQQLMRSRPGVSILFAPVGSGA